MSLDPQRFIDIFRIAALQAGSVASRLQGEVRTQRKAGAASPEAQALTAVDLATQDVVLHLLHALLPQEAGAHHMTAWAIRGSGCWRQSEGESPLRIARPQPPDRILITPRTSPDCRRRLASLAAETQVSRCSAVDASAPALGRAKAALSPKRSDRWRAIGYLLTLEAGGHVQLGDQVWRGEDPDALGSDAAPSIVASSRALAREILKTCRG